MFKNKDGSYNKFQILIVSLITIIGIGIIGSTLITETPDVDSTTIAIIGLITSGGLAFYYGKKVFFKPKPTISHMMQTSTPSNMRVIETHQGQFTVEDEPIVKIEKIKKPREEPTGSGFGLSGLSALVISLVIAGVGLMVGTVVLNSLMQALPEVSSNSPMSSSATSISESVSSAFNIATIGMLCITMVGIVIMFRSLILSTDLYD